MLLEDPTDVPPATSPPRPVVVQKYGGSSVADNEKLGRVADRVVATQRAGNDVVVVVSAMGKTTDGLLARAREVAGRSEPPRRELDMLVSTGERVAMSLLSIAIRARGLEAISFTGSQCGIITNDRHFDARIIEVRPHRIEDELARGRVVIVAGYQGMSYRREITTLGRGGTDTTAVALAASLQAERCEIYSDVDGVYSADPRVVAEAQHLPEVDFEMLQEMAHAGAKVVCAHAVEWARRAGIAIYARSTFDPITQSPRQTLIRRFGPKEGVTARAVTADQKIALVELEQVAALSQILDIIGACKVPVGALETHGGRASIRLSLLNAPDWPAARKRLEQIDGCCVSEGVALLSVVGANLAEPEAVTSFRTTLARLTAAPRALSISPIRLSAVVDQSRSDELQRALHAELVAS